MQNPEKTEIGQPPIFKTWRGMYLAVIGALLVQIIIYYAITRYFL